MSEIDMLPEDCERFDLALELFYSGAAETFTEALDAAYATIGDLTTYAGRWDRLAAIDQQETRQ